MTEELGRTRDTIGNIMEYGDQSLIELDKKVSEPVEILLNGELFARGEVITVGENFGVRVIEVVSRPGD
jgi:flagellar motor switch protein FliN/FliY|tara:strand:- start:74 stop:280 length:207 start_codon:yes stop_codon:yes gene_type:complete